MKPSIRATLEARGVLLPEQVSGPPDRRGPEASIEVPGDQQTQGVRQGVGPGACCRLCGRSYAPEPGSCDYRCPVCRAAGRWWTREQIGTRAQVFIRSRESAFCGETGVGERVSTPEDGWQVNLLSGGKAMFFGASAVSVDYEIPKLREPERPFLVRVRATTGQI